MKSSVGIVGILSAVLLAGCATAPATQASAVPIVISHDVSKPTPMAHIPASLGLLAPAVANYQCSGSYAPAARVEQSALTPPSEVAPPFWRLTIECVHPSLKSDLPKGTLRAGTVWIFEDPATPNATTLLQAIAQLSPTSQLTLSNAGRLRVGVGRVGFAGASRSLVWFLGGRTAWTDVHRQAHARVLVYLTGRAVSIATLKTFAQSMRPLSR